MLFSWLILVFILEYTRPDHFLPFITQLKLYSILPLGLFFVTLVSATRTPNSEVLKSTTGKLLLALLLIASVSALFAINKNMAWDKWRALLGYIFLFFMVAKLCDDRKKIAWLFRTVVGMHLLLIFQNPALLTDPNLRSYVENVTFLGDGNDFSLSVAVALPMSLYLFQSTKSKAGKVFYVLAAIVLLGAVMGTQSRGAAIAIIAVVLYLWTLSPHKGKGIVVIASGLLVVLAVASETYISRMQTISHYQEDGSAMGRIEAWKGGIKMANERPLVGMGPGCFSVAFGSRYAPPGWPWLTAHSMYFLALGELGYPGLLLFLWLLWTLFRGSQRIIRSIPRDTEPERLEYRRLLIAVTGSIIAFAVGGAFLSVLYYPHLYVICGITFAVWRIYELDCAKGEESISTRKVEKCGSVNAVPDEISRHGRSP
ncbi:MAG: hypothetical protein DWQ09_07470 [Proteobacteria bacterium]|nr:MAG: hypothetical protein DWQ09_07470 [Pseudomonadota bacterium]QKK12072.1 MAG: hypothetical protein HND59_11260 [Pseudomonadota bacterium]